MAGIGLGLGWCTKPTSPVWWVLSNVAGLDSLDRNVFCCLVVFNPPEKLLPPSNVHYFCLSLCCLFSSRRLVPRREGWAVQHTTQEKGTSGRYWSGCWSVSHHVRAAILQLLTLFFLFFFQRLKFEIAEVMTEIEQLTCVGERWEFRVRIMIVRTPIRISPTWGRLGWLNLC